MARVALPVPLNRTFGYSIPDGMQPHVGSRVRIPFGKGERAARIGIVMEVAQANAGDRKLRAIEHLIDPQPLLDRETLALFEWACGYYHGVPGDALELLLPPGLRAGAPAEPRRIAFWRLTPAGAEAPPKAAARKQLALHQLLERHPEGLDATALDAHSATWRAAVRPMMERGLIERVEREPEERMKQARPLHPLTDEQTESYERIRRAFGRFEAFLLHGITGSGKTEVYIALARECLARGESVLLLLPEITLTPQTCARMQEAIAAPVAVLHSDLSNGDRTEEWLRCARGKAKVLIGTRSAVMTPMPNLGLIVVDEEHDTSLKQSERGLRYHARDVAVMRGRRLGIPVVLASATPSLESLHNAQAQRYTYLRLSRRPGGAQLPQIDIIDLREAGALHAGLSGKALEEIRTTVARGEQVLVFLNRRGWSRSLVCDSCGWHSACAHCDADMAVHTVGRQRLLCHHCATEAPIPNACPQCGSQKTLHTAGEGTQRIEDELEAEFPNQVVRIDRDAIHGRDALADAINAIREGRTKVLVGTQMLAKGHDFPDLTLVVVLGIDGSLYNADFRARERAAQLLIQVSGRAGRATKPGRVLVQTRRPDHPLFADLPDYGRIAGALLQQRENATEPPFSYQAILRARSARPAAAAQFLSRALALTGPHDGLRIDGPLPLPIERVKGQHRAALVLTAKSRPALQRLLQGWRERIIETQHANPDSRDIRWAIDVDPVSFE